MPRALIFANGEFSRPELARSIPQPDDVIIAADGGARHALALGRLPSLIIGDFDSLTEPEMNHFASLDVQFLRFPQAKDETDLELALYHSIRAGHDPILILGALGGRLDQMLGNIALLSDPQLIHADIRLEDGVTEVFFVTDKTVIQGSPGDTVSLIPWGGPVEGVITAGLLYPLNNETLFPSRTRGISNEMLAQNASVRISAGSLLCTHIRKI